MKTINKNYLILILVISVSIILDQVSKIILLEVVEWGERQVEVTSFFNLVMVWNRGVSFGLFPADSDMGRGFLILVAIAVSAVVLYWFHRESNCYNAISTGLIVGGAVGNIIDRVRFGAVADFFDFHVMGYHWPAFNIADSCIFVGVLLILIAPIFNKSSLNV